MADTEPNFEESARQDLDPKVKEVYGYLFAYGTHPKRREWMKRRKDAWEGGIENKQWSDKEIEQLQKQDMVPLVINKCNKGVQGSAAIVTANRPDVLFHPLGDDDLWVAELLKRAHDRIWEKNDNNDNIKDMVEETKLGGVGFIDAHFNPNKGIYGQIVNEETDPTDIYYDANARKRDYSDTHIIKAKLRTRTYIKENYEDLKDEDLDYKFSLDDAADSKEESGNDQYVQSEDFKAETQGAEKYTEKRNVWEIEALLLKTVKENWVVEAGPKARKLEDGEEIREGQKLWKRRYEKRIQRIIVGKKLISEVENPYGEDSESDPVVNLIGLKHQRTLSAYPMSPTSYALPLNKEKNKRRAQFILNASHNVNSPIAEPEGTKWVDSTGKTSASPGTPGTRAKIPKDAQFAPTRIPPGSMEAGKFLQLEQLSDADIDDQYDLHEVMRGKMPKVGESRMSGRMVLALQDMGGTMSQPFQRNLESCMIRVAKVNMVLAMRHWPKVLWKRLLDPRELKDQTLVNPEDPSEGTFAIRWMNAVDRCSSGDLNLMDFDVKMSPGSTMPTNRIAKMEVAIGNVEAGIWLPEHANDYMDDPNKEKIKQDLKAARAAAAEQGKK